ncbi:MAG: alginate lyase family protein [Candidatus Obscuribacterales bacterium]|nr:alginate lyase family protein [Candidatus Obscuribacterales bacterium]
MRKKTKKPVTDFAEYVIESIDGQPRWSKLKNLSIESANATLEEWARADALRSSNDTNGRYSRQGGINRRIMIGTMAMLALKLKAHGVQLGPNVTPWLGKRVHELIANWHKANATGGNLYVQDGFTSAVYRLLAYDKICYQAQDEIWQNGIKGIDENGYVATEITRGRRALVYHLRYLNYLLFLRAARRSLGIHTRPWEERRLKALGALICRTQCDQKEMSSKANSTDMEIPGDWGTRVLVAFGEDLLTQDWEACGTKVKAFGDPSDGGDLNIVKKMFDDLAAQRDKQAKNSDAQPPKEI